MQRDRYVRRTSGGNAETRRPVYPRLLRRNRSRGAVRGTPRRGTRIIARLLLFLVLGTVLSSVVMGASAFGAYTQITESLKPRLEALNNRQTFQTSRIFDRNGTLLYEFFDAGKRTKVKLEDISPLLIKATVAIEDKTFFTNPGIDIEGIARTLYSSFRAGEETGGGSTITQQLIKSVVLTEEERAFENRYQRKLKEIVLAQELDQRYSKNQIIELYLNEIFYGNLAYGIEAASDVYFKTSAKNLTLAQASLLAGLPQLPSRYNPINYLQRDEQGGFLPGVRLSDNWLKPDYDLPDTITPPRWRQIAVLRQMVDEGYVTETEARTAVAADLRFAPQEVPLNAPHFVFYVRDLIEEKYGKQLLNGGGLNIYTSLDLDLQRMVQQKAAERIAELEARNIHNAAVVVMQPNTGQILAMVGSIDYNKVLPTTTSSETGNVLDGQVNVTTRERQPGSALKPFTYLAAMEQGMTPATVLWDVPTEFPTGTGQWYAPKNYNGRWNGPVRIRTALANSLNMPAVKALKFAGISNTLNLLDRVGIKSGLKRGEDFYGLSLTLGGGEVTPLELTSAYNTLASGGRYYPPVSILRISDSSGQVLESYTPQPGQQVVDAALVSIISDMLSDDNARRAVWGLNSPLKLSRPAAVKTGTTNDWRDAWAAGYTPFVTVGVWTGNNNNETTEQVESLSGGGIIWRNVMEEIFARIDTRPDYRSLFGAPTGGVIPTSFQPPPTGSMMRGEICTLPGSFGGYSSELFTQKMVTNVLSTTSPISPTSASTGGTGGEANTAASTVRIRCDAYRRFTVVKLPDVGSDTEASDGGEEPVSTARPRYCRPVEGETYPQGSLQTLYSWNFPPPDPSIKVEYRWSGGSAGANPNSFPQCTADMFAPPKPQPPVENAVQMPDLTRLGENQAKDVLKRLGVTNIYVDYQSRERIPDVYDQFLPYTVVSTVPRANDWILPGTMVVLGIRAPDPAPSQATPITAPQPPPEAVPQPTPAPAPPQEPPQPQPTPPTFFTPGPIVLPPNQ